MVTYSVEEDRLLLHLRDELSSSRGPDWNRITKRFDTEFGRITHKKYTIAMLRNRLARIEGSRGTKARNRCGLCGKLLAGHTCKRIQEPITVYVPPKPKKVVVANSRQGARNRVVKRVPDFSYHTESEDEAPSDTDDIELPTEAEISEAFMEISEAFMTYSTSHASMIPAVCFADVSQEIESFDWSATVQA